MRGSAFAARRARTTSRWPFWAANVSDADRERNVLFALPRSLTAVEFTQGCTRTLVDFCKGSQQSQRVLAAQHEAARRLVGLAWRLGGQHSRRQVDVGAAVDVEKGLTFLSTAVRKAYQRTKDSSR